jgi:hypothetical protein
MFYELMYYDRLGQGLAFERYRFFCIAWLRAVTMRRDQYASITRGRSNIIWRRSQ